MSTGRSSIGGSIRVMTVDDHPLFRQGIATLIDADDDIELVAEASDGEQAIVKFRLHRSDVILMDIQMPNMNGIESISRIRQDFFTLRFLCFDLCGRCSNLTGDQSGCAGVSGDNVDGKALLHMRTWTMAESEFRPKLRRSWPNTLATTS